MTLHTHCIVTDAHCMSASACMYRTTEKTILRPVHDHRRCSCAHSGQDVDSIPSDPLSLDQKKSCKKLGGRLWYQLRAESFNSCTAVSYLWAASGTLAQQFLTCGHHHEFLHSSFLPVGRITHSSTAVSYLWAESWTPAWPACCRHGCHRWWRWRLAPAAPVACCRPDQPGAGTEELPAIREKQNKAGPH